MNLLNLLMGSLGSDNSINALSKKTGVNSSLLTKLLPLAIPILLKALTKNAGKEGGVASLLTALGQHKNTRSIPDQINEVDEDDGRKIVAHILGDDSDQIVSALAQETGMEGADVSRSLGALAPALMSMLSGTANSVHSSGVNLADGFENNSWGNISSMAFATSGGVKTSSLDRLAMQDSTSGLYIVL